MAYKAEVLTDARCIVGEGPLWDERTRCLRMVDIQGKRMRSIHWDSGRIEDTVLPQQTALLLPEVGGGFLGGAEDGVYRIGEGGDFRRVSAPITLKGQRFNDGKVGPDGRAYLGTFSRDRSAAFYRMDTDGVLTELFDDVGNSNGLDWCADGTKMYYNDTPTGRTDVFDFDAGTGSLSNRRTVFHYAYGRPDGMTVDADGNLWVALWGAGCVVCIDPEKGDMIRKLELPVRQVASCAFAGERLDTLVITTAAHGIHLKEEPLAGAVFAVEMDVRGVQQNQIALRV